MRASLREYQKDIPCRLSSLMNRSMGTEMVKLVVGAESPKSSDNTFLVHKDLLCRKIPYFKNMFTDGWKESDEKGATFPEDDVKSFDVLLGWVYTGVLK